MGFRNPGGTSGLGGGFGTPTSSIEIGDAVQQGGTGLYADAGHQHSFPRAAPGSVGDLAPTANDGSSSRPAAADHGHAHTAAMHQDGGHADLSGYFVRRALYDAAGDLLVGAGDDALSRLAVGTVAGQALLADPSQPLKVKWGDPVFALRRLVLPDGVDLTVAGGCLPSWSTGNNLNVAAGRLFISGVPVDLGGASLAFARPGSGVNWYLLVGRVDRSGNTVGYALKLGSGSMPALQQDDISGGTGIYEVRVAHVWVPPTGTPYILYNPVVTRGLDGGNGSVIKVADVTLGADSATVDVPNIPLDFKSLRIVAGLRGTNAALTQGVNFQALTAPSDAGAGFASPVAGSVVEYANSGGSPTVGARASGANPAIGTMPGATATARNVSAIECELAGYADPDASTGRRKTLNGINHFDVGSLVSLQKFHAQYDNVGTLNRVRLFTAGGGNIAAGSSMAVYGVR